MGVDTLLQDRYFIFLLLGFGMFRRTGIARTLEAKSRILLGSLGFPWNLFFECHLKNYSLDQLRILYRKRTK